MAETRLQKKVFSKIHMDNLVYNTCWEDPRCDRELMEFGPDAKVVMITSAGCNALDYLLDNPAQIHCVDMNPRQNALLHLKMASLQSQSHQDIFQLFGVGRHPKARECYYDSLRSIIPSYAMEFWDRKIQLFAQNGLRGSFYHRSTSGTLAWLIMNFTRTRPRLRKAVRQLMDCTTLDQQREIYPQVEKMLFGPFIQWLMNRNLTLYLAGVPVSQKKLMEDSGNGGVIGYIKASLRHVFMNLPVSENYFWRVYVHGAYSDSCSPNYLKKENQTLLSERVDRIKTYNQTLSGFLQENPGEYTHFILLDHQDWLSRNNKPALQEEWELILRNSAPKAKVLLRSAAPKVEFIPSFVRERVEFQPEKAMKSALKDRVGTYAGIEMGVIR